MSKLLDAVREHMGCEDSAEFRDTMREVAEHGANAGWPKFTYYSDTCAFWKGNRFLILEALREDAESSDANIIDLVAGFRCLKDVGVSTWAIAEVLTDPKIKGETGNGNAMYVENALAWYALERAASEVAS